MPDLVLHGLLVFLRPLRSSDASALDRVLRDRRATRFLPPRVRQETGRQFAFRVLRERRIEGGAPFVIVPTGATEGIGQIRLFNWSRTEHVAEVGFWMRRKYWGHGLGTESLRLICRFGFRSMGLHRIEASVVVGNSRSKRALERAGFRVEGTSRRAHRLGGRWVDSWRLGLLRGELRQTTARSIRRPARGRAARGR